MLWIHLHKDKRDAGNTTEQAFHWHFNRRSISRIKLWVMLLRWTAGWRHPTQITQCHACPESDLIFFNISISIWNKVSCISSMFSMCWSWSPSCRLVNNKRCTQHVNRGYILHEIVEIFKSHQRHVNIWFAHSAETALKGWCHVVGQCGLWPVHRSPRARKCVRPSAGERIISAAIAEGRGISSSPVWSEEASSFLLILSLLHWLYYSLSSSKRLHPPPHPTPSTLSHSLPFGSIPPRFLSPPPRLH